MVYWSPLCRWPVHDDVDPQDLHGVQWVWQLHQRGQRYQRQRCYTPETQVI